MLTEFFISILSDFLNHRDTERPKNDISWNGLIEVAKRHEVSGILYYQCKRIIPAKYLDSLEKSYASTLFYYSNRIAEETTILNILKKNGIICFVIKGSSVASYYPIPSLRTMGDTDFLVDDIKKTHRLLLESGYSCNVKYSAYSKRNMLFETHNKLVQDDNVNNPSLVSFLNNWQEHINNGELDWSFHLLFLIIHLRHHLYGNGIGIRQFFDIAVITKNNKNIDWKWFEKTAKEYGIWTFSQNVLDLNRIWFGVKTPLTIKNVDESFFNEVTVELFSGGVFGKESNSARRTAAQGNAHPKLYMIKQALTILFLPYKYMIHIPQYKFLIGKPFLLPIAWGYRALLTIKTKGVIKSTKIIRSTFANQESIDDEREFINKWE